MKQLIFFLLLFACAICSNAQTTWIITTHPDSSTQFKSFVGFNEKNLVQIKVKPNETRTIQLGKGQNILPNVFTIDAPLDPDVVWVIEYTAKKVGSGTPIPIIQTVDANDFTGAWKKDPAGGFSYSNLTGQTLTYSFEGSGIKLVGQKLNSYGKVSVQIDSGAPVIIDMYSATLIKPFMFYETTFAQGSHTVVVKVTGQKNAASVNSYCVLDYVVITKQ